MTQPLLCILLLAATFADGDSVGYLPFLSPIHYSTFRNVDDGAVSVSLPTPLHFGSSSYTTAYISSNGLVSFGQRYTSFTPVSFPINVPVIAPYWDDIHLTRRRELRYAIIRANDLSVFNQVNEFLSNSTGSTVIADWILWAYWYNVCPYTDRTCSSHQSNYIQVAIAVQKGATYAVFIYQCGLIRWTLNNATVGFSANSTYYENHPLSKTSSITNIDCDGAVSQWSNVVYRINNDTLYVRPWYGTYLGGVPVFVSGPYFKESDQISVSFDDVIVNCTHLNGEEALCATPFLTKVGFVSVRLYIDGYFQEGRTTRYYSIPLENEAAEVDIRNSSKKIFTSGDTLDISWSPSSLISNEIDANFTNFKVNIRMFEIQATSDGTYIHKEVASLATDIPNTGRATVTIPPASLNESRICSVNILVQVTGLTVSPVQESSTRQSRSAIRSVINSLLKIGIWSSPLILVDVILWYPQCLLWAAREPDRIGSTILESVRQVAPCPRDVEQCYLDSSGLEEDNALIFIFHPKAAKCFRQKEPTNSGYGNQCCYRSNGTLIVGPSGGTVDKVATAGSSGFDYAIKVAQHFDEDVLPYLYCCMGWPRNCSKYYERRPIDNGSGLNPPPACVYGDPHIVTLDLLKYTFNGKGEFTLIETSDQSFTLQGRMTQASDINNFNARGTVFTAVAAKQNDSDRVQFEIDSNNAFLCCVNGEVINFSEIATQTFENVTVSGSANNTFTASFTSGAFLKVQEMNGFIAVLIVSLPDRYRAQTYGLMGNYNGDESDDLIPQGGNLSIPINSSLQTIHEEFGITWIIDNANSSLFSYGPFWSWLNFYSPYFIPVYETTFSHSSLKEQANQICQNDEFCKFDIATTGRIEIGEATYEGGIEFQRIVNLSQPVTCDPPCAHGVCVADNVCVCGEGYTGDTCDIIVLTSCSENPCNGGTCQYHAGTYICTCLPEFSGEFCEVSLSTSFPLSPVVSASSLPPPASSPLPPYPVPADTAVNVGQIAGVVSAAGVLTAILVACIVTGAVCFVLCTKKSEIPHHNKQFTAYYYEDAENHVYEDTAQNHVYEDMTEMDYRYMKQSAKTSV